MAKKTGHPTNAEKYPNPITFTDGGKLSAVPLIEPPDFKEIRDLKKRMFLQALAVNGPNYAIAARAAGVSLSGAARWRRDPRDHKFQAALELAMKMGIESAEAELYRRGVHGYRKPVYHHGKLVGTTQEYSDTAVIFWLKGAAPEKYADRFQHSGQGGGPIQTESKNLLVTLSSEDLQVRMQAALDTLKSAGVLSPTATSSIGALPPAPPPIAEEPPPVVRERVPLEPAQAFGNGGLEPIKDEIKRKLIDIRSGKVVE